MSVPAGDATVLRFDPSATGGVSGQATAPRVLKQRFVLDEKLGSGGMGTVYRAKDLRKVEARDRHPYVAVKVLNDDFRAHPEAFIALQREAAKSQGLSHRNIVSIFDFDKDGDVPFIIMELLEGEELADLLRTYPTGLPDELLWPIVRCMCDGLEHAHEAGLVHADFKPGNVFVSPDHSAKILDFGIARAVRLNQAAHSEALADDTLFDPTRLAALTPAYASPQMLDGAEAVPRDDLFSLGVVIYLMVTGAHPFGRVPANEAARNGMRLERPRRLGRRQWRVLERCLAFSRERRPADVAELRRHLFQPSPWRSRTALVAAGAVVLTGLISGLKEDVAVQEAKVEVRQTTLVDAQFARLEALLSAPALTPAWEDTVAEEVTALRALLPAGAKEPQVLARIRARYAEAVAAAEDSAQALALHQRALQYGPAQDVTAALRSRLVGDVVALLDAPLLEGAWLDALDHALARVGDAFPGGVELAELRLETADVLEAELTARVAAERFPAARRALEFLEVYSFDPDRLDQMRRDVDAAERAYTARQTAVLRETERVAFRDELAAQLGGPCLSFDPGPAAAVFDRWVARRPAFAAAGRAQVGERVNRCLSQLEALDGDRARVLKQQAVARFGPLPGMESERQDPCAAAYLVDNGAQGGRRGSCADALGDGAAATGPRLVVVSGSAGALAFMREEASWRDLNEFCAGSGRCPERTDPDQPVTGVPVTLARDYAAWLSERSGFNYRLPSYGEWLNAARGTEDPNRNCRVQLGGVQRGVAPVAAATGTPNGRGLVNALGNVQEWVTDGAELKAAGGAFSDPIADCSATTLRRHEGTADTSTGFRLVRDVSARGAS